MAHAETLGAQKTVRHDTHRTRLAHHADRAVLWRSFNVHGRKRQDRAGAKVGQALRVWADHAHSGSSRREAHPLLLGFARNGIGFAEARSHYHGTLHPNL